jgi:hypothetical protein
VEKVGEDTPRQFHPGLWDPDLSADLQEGLAASGAVDFEVGSMVAEEEVVSEAVSKTVEDMVVVEVAEVVLVIQEAEASLVVEGDLVVTEVPMDTVPLPMRPLAPVVGLVDLPLMTEEAVVSAEEDTAVLDRLSATETQRQLVGMFRVVVAAHMMIETVATAAAAEATTTVTPFAEVVAIWSR